MRVIYSGTMETLEVSTSAAWVKVPLSSQAWIDVFGPAITATVDLSIGHDDEPNYRSVLFFMLLGGWMNNRRLDIWLKLDLICPLASPQRVISPPEIGDWNVDDPNFVSPFGFSISSHEFYWSCERVIASPHER